MKKYIIFKKEKKKLVLMWKYSIVIITLLRADFNNYWVWEIEKATMSL